MRRCFFTYLTFLFTLFIIHPAGAADIFTYFGEIKILNLDIPVFHDELNYSINPNPVQLGQDLSITFTDYDEHGIIKLKVLDVIGNKIFYKEFHPAKTIELNISAGKFRIGVYILEIEQGNTITRKRINIVD
ncbi:MAG: T9SS type A sorting domain-containing protein [Bacteroidia bacterium]|nr:T9SS type A sorting domain-containing protein [Bacteroidia bacterium]